MKALLPGSFDPPTLGHLDLVRRAAALVDELVVGVGRNPDRTPLLSTELRVELLAAECAELADVRVLAYAGSTAACAAAEGTDLLIRGLRGYEDWPHESFLAAVNRRCGLETLLLPADPALVHCRGSHVRQVLAAGHDVGPYVTPRVAEALAAL